MNQFQKKLKAVRKKVALIEKRGFSDNVELEIGLEKGLLPELMVAANTIEYAQGVYWFNYWFGRMRRAFVTGQKERGLEALDNVISHLDQLKALK